MPGTGVNERAHLGMWRAMPHCRVALRVDGVDLEGIRALCSGIDRMADYGDHGTAEASVCTVRMLASECTLGIGDRVEAASRVGDGTDGPWRALRVLGVADIGGGIVRVSLEADND